MTKEGEEEEEEEKQYKNPILYLRKSAKGGHLYAFNIEERVGRNVKTLLMNVSDVQAVIEGKMEWAKVSVLSPEEE